MKNNYKIITLIFFLSAIFLRVLLWYVNPPWNAFDDHFEPIFYILKYGMIPAKDACRQCYQPPVFYFISSIIGKIAIDFGIGLANLFKLMQFNCCIYGILTVAIIYLILQEIQLSKFSRLFAFGTICFLPRHIYMSAMNSNDTISYLGVAICIYLLIITIKRNFTIRSLIMLNVALTITLYTKYTCFVLLPIMLTVLFLGLKTIQLANRKKYLILFILTFLIPISFLSFSTFANIRNYGSPIPWNLQFLDPSVSQSCDEGGVNYLSFNIWKSIKNPILAPGNLNSFWTLIYSGMWFDTEPKFLDLMDSNIPWWIHYYDWLFRGEQKYPGDNPSVSKLTILEGSGLIMLGLFPLFLVIVGIFRYLTALRNDLTKSNWLELTKMSIFPVLLIFNTCGIVAITFRLPVFSAMKSSYFLNSMPAFAIFLGVGIMPFENYNIFRAVTSIIFAAIFALVSLHIIHIFFAIING